MIDDDSKDFKIDAIEDENHLDSLYQEEMKDLRMEKLSHRVTIISILIPCLIGVILFIVYRDLTGRVSRTEFTGTKEVQALSKELEEKFKNLSTQYTDLQTSLSKKIVSVEKATSGLTENLKALNNSVKSVKQNQNKSQTNLKSIIESKVDKKEQAATIAKINNSLGPLRKEVEALAPVSKNLSKLSSQMQALDKNLKAELTSLSATITKTTNDLNQIQTSLSILADQKLDRESVDLEMLKAKKNYERALDQAVLKIEERIDLLLNRTKQLENKLRKLEATATKAPVAKPKAPPKTTTSGGIVEQDIKE
jgi:septal ring factor EnvC (AmiA/AmiB activator)